MQKEKDGRSSGTSAHVPQLKNKSNMCPGKNLATTKAQSGHCSVDRHPHMKKHDQAWLHW